jgi:UDP-N-acetylglucosamine acyltransferase
VIVGNQVTLGAGAAVHQHCRIGSLSVIGTQALVVQDVPPFFMVDGLTGRIAGLNLVGLTKSGRTPDEIEILESAYSTLYRSELTWKETINTFQTNYSTGPVSELTQFLLTITQRGIVREQIPRLRVLTAHEPDKDVAESESQD